MAYISHRYYDSTVNNQFKFDQATQPSTKYGIVETSNNKNH